MDAPLDPQEVGPSSIQRDPIGLLGLGSGLASLVTWGMGSLGAIALWVATERCRPRLRADRTSRIAARMGAILGLAGLGFAALLGRWLFVCNGNPGSRALGASRSQDLLLLVGSFVVPATMYLLAVWVGISGGERRGSVHAIWLLSAAGTMLLLALLSGLAGNAGLTMFALAAAMLSLGASLGAMAIGRQGSPWVRGLRLGAVAVLLIASFAGAIWNWGLLILGAMGEC